MSRLRVAVAALVTCAALAACGGGGDGGGTAEVAGSVIEVFNRLASVDGKRVAGGDEIKRRAVVETDDGGAAKFSVGRKLDDCQIHPDSAAQVLPQPGVLLDYQRGWTVCKTTYGDLDRVELTAKNRRLTMQDPVWAVGVLPGAVTLRVFRGFVDLRAPTGPGRLVGPDSQSTAPDGGEAAPAEHFDRSLLGDLDRRGVERMEAGFPAPNLGFPSSGGSPALAEIRRRGSLRLAVDGSRSAPAAAFIGAYFDFLGRHWDVAIEVVPSRRPATDVEQGRVDLAVVPSPGAASGIPFFDDEQPRPWSMVVADPGLATGLRTFLLGVLDVGDYGRQYRAAFGTVPSYEAVRPLVLPDPGTQPGPTTAPPIAPTTSAPTTLPATTTSTAPPGTTTTTRPGPTTTAAPALRVEITSGSVKNPSPAICPATVIFTWTVRADRAGTVTYRVTRSDGAGAPLQTLTFDAAGTKRVEDTWTLGADYSGWQALEIESPQPLRNRLDFAFSCQKGPF